MSCESFILLHEMQTKLMAFDKLKEVLMHKDGRIEVMV